MSRTYLDWNATAPLRSEARDAMQAAMDTLGNPSSIHSEGREARALIETARDDIKHAMGALNADVIFTSGATESAALALAGRGLKCAQIEHGCVLAWGDPVLSTSGDGQVVVDVPVESTLQRANGETGIIQELPKGLAVVDFVQAFGKMVVNFDRSGAEMGLLSAHKFGGPKGVGALIIRKGSNLEAQIKGGGQEMGYRSGSENVIGIAGFAAAAKAALRDLEAGVWQRVAALRDKFEERLADGAKDIVFFGTSGNRLANTSYFAVKGWSGETQVMQMDIGGYAVSAGSACSSGKVSPSQVLLAMGYDALTAASAIRMSIGAETHEADLAGFADFWLKKYDRFKGMAA